MSRRTKQQLVEQRLTDIRNNKNRKGFKWGFSDKTGWDWLDLTAKLAIPLILGIATLLFSIQQANLAQQQHEVDKQQALDQQRQAILVTYEGDMKDLLLNRGLLTSKSNDEIRVIARTETLSAMRQLDGKRNSSLIQFLQDAHLNGVDPNTRRARYTIVNFLYADLRYIDFSGVNFSGANFSGAILIGANFGGAILYNVDLSGAILYNANLSRAYLGGANLNGTLFKGANLNGADFNEPDLNSADLSGADLGFSPDLSQEQLDAASTCKDAILPQGLTCHHNQ